jgi:hypothetical protein
MKSIILILFVLSVSVFADSTAVVASDTTVKQMDSVQQIINSIVKPLTMDKAYKQILNQQPEDQIRYLRQLLSGHYRDSISVAFADSLLIEAAQQEYQKFYILLQATDESKKALVHGHMLKIRGGIRTLQNFYEQVHPNKVEVIVVERTKHVY